VRSIVVESKHLSNTLVSIQVLRGLAVSLVVIHHAITFLNDKYAVNLVEFDLGAIGVDIFFVISGFVMFWTTRSHVGSWPDTLQFWKKRVIRIIPLYWAMTVSLAGALLFSPSLFKSMELNGAWLLKSLFFIPYLNEWGRPHPMIDPGWTLNYEMFFYLVFGGCLCSGRRHATMICLLLLALSVLAGLWLAPASAVLATYTNPLLLEFCAGLLCGALYQRFGIYRPVIGLVILIMIGCWLAIGQADFPGSDLRRAALWGGASVLIVLSFLSLESLVHDARYLSLSKLIGDASYSIYLGHTIFFLAFGKLADLMHVKLFTPVWIVVGAVFVGVGTYRFLERPLGHAVNHMTSKPRYRAGAPSTSEAS